MSNVLGIYSAPCSHWVGDGFPVRSLLSAYIQGDQISPFIMLDYASPAQFAPTDRPRGVGQHPHRGFETVTIVYQGELEHRDSTGRGGRIGPGDVQWMTAASGILHEEFHSRDFTKNGGTLEMIQLWVNLPAKDKMAAPGYQTLLSKDIPAVALGDGVGTLRVIAGAYDGHEGPARTFTPVNVWDVRLNRDKAASITLREGHTAIAIVLSGAVLINDRDIVREAQTVLLGRDGGRLALEANGDAKLLILTGEPINEPVVAHGPFVMNTEAEIHQAMADFQSGRFGAMAH
jgi:redox-sensitive bicupin YhaK (pirin superfamily)